MTMHGQNHIKEERKVHRLFEIFHRQFKSVT